MAARTQYDQDFFAWTEQQAEALRAASRGTTNQPLDWENLAEEIESLGRSDRRELHSQIHRIVQHLLKLQFAPATDPRRGWLNSISDARLQVELVLADSPSLRSQLDRIISLQTPKVIERALFDLGEFGEIDRAVEKALRQARYSVDQVLGDWLPPAPASSAAARDF